MSRSPHRTLSWFLVAAEIGNVTILTLFFTFFARHLPAGFVGTTLYAYNTSIIIPPPAFMVGKHSFPPPCICFASRVSYA